MKKVYLNLHQMIILKMPKCCTNLSLQETVILEKKGRLLLFSSEAATQRCSLK